MSACEHLSDPDWSTIEGPFLIAGDAADAPVIAEIAAGLPWDAEGRIVLPEDMIAHARLAETAAFVGKGRTFQLWEPDQLKQAMEEIRKRATANPPTLALRRPVPGSNA